jgi:hypothetical protein
MMPETQGKPLPDSLEDVQPGHSLRQAEDAALHAADDDRRFVLTDAETETLDAS